MTYRMVMICLTMAVFMGCSNDAENSAPPGAGSASDVTTESSNGIDTDSAVADSEGLQLPKVVDTKSFAATHQISVPTEYYTGGPQQGRPPDGTFESGTKVKLLEAAGSYSLVESDSGVQGYVAADALSAIE